MEPIEIESNEEELDPQPKEIEINTDEERQIIENAENTVEDENVNILEELNRETTNFTIQQSLEQLISSQVVETTSAKFKANELQNLNIRKLSLKRKIAEINAENVDLSHQIELDQIFFQNSKEVLQKFNEFIDIMSNKTKGLKESFKTIIKSELLESSKDLNRKFSALADKIQTERNDSRNEYERAKQTKLKEIRYQKQLLKSLQKFQEHKINEIEDLNNSNAYHTTIIENITLKMPDLEAEIQTMEENHKTQVELAQQKLDEQKQLINEMNKGIENAENRLKSFHNEKEDKMQELKQKEESYTIEEIEFKKSVEEHLEVLREKNVKIEAMKEKIALKKNENNQFYQELVTRNETLLKLISEIKNENESTQNEIAEVQNDVMKLSEKKITLFEKDLQDKLRVANLKIKLQEAKTNNIILNKEKEKLQHQEENLKRDLLNQTLEIQKTKDDDLIPKKYQILNELKAKQGSITDLINENKHLILSKQFLEDEANHLDELLKQSSEENENRKQENDNLTVTVQQRSQSLDNLKLKANELKKEIETLKLAESKPVENNDKNVTFNDLISFKSITESESSILNSPQNWTDWLKSIHK